MLIERPVRHVDHRGSLFEAVNPDHPFWSEPIVSCEWVVTAPGMIKGWGMHLESTDRYVLGSGRMRVVLYDGRLDSPTHGRIAQFHFSEQAPGWLRIPCGVWHANQNYGDVDATFVNFPTEAYSLRRSRQVPDRRIRSIEDRLRLGAPARLTLAGGATSSAAAL